MANCYLPSNTRNEGHYNDVIMGAMASQTGSLMIIYSNVDSSADQTKHQSSASLASVRRIHRWPVNYPHKGPVTRKMFPFDDVIMYVTRGLLMFCQTTQNNGFDKCAFVRSYRHFSVDIMGCVCKGKQDKRLPSECYGYVWQVSPRPNCSDTGQIWMWSDGTERYFCKSDTGKIKINR